MDLLKVKIMSQETPVQKRFNWKRLAWEMLGVLVVLVVVGLPLVALAGGIADKSIQIRHEKESQRRKVIPPSVVVKEMRPERVVDSLSLPGMVEPLVTVKIPAEVEGRILRRLVGEGDRVTRGQTIMEIDPVDYDIRLETARAVLEHAELAYKRAESLLGQKATAKSEFDALNSQLRQAHSAFLAAELARKRCSIVSPIDGEVAWLGPEEGEWIASAATVATVLDLDRVKVTVAIPEREVAAVRKMGECLVQIPSAGENGKPLIRPAKKIRLSLEPRPGTQVYGLELEMDNSDRLVSAGMFVEADVVRGIRSDSYLALTFAVLAEDSAYSVFVVDDVKEVPDPEGKLPPDRMGVARRKNVRIGAMLGREVEILPDPDGVKAGDYLVVLGQRDLDDGREVRIAKQIDGYDQLGR